MKSCKKCEFCRLVKFIKKGKPVVEYYMCMRYILMVEHPIIKSSICGYYLKDDNWKNHKSIIMDLDRVVMDINEYKNIK